MTHFIGAVLVPVTVTDRGLDAYLHKALELYDEQREVPTYPVEPDPVDIEAAAKHYGVDSVTPEQMCEYDGRDWHLVDDMLIPFSVYNPESKFDYWTVGGRWEDDLEPQQFETVDDLRARIQASIDNQDDEGPGIIPKHVVIPNGHYPEWHSAEDVMWFGLTTETVNAEQWHLQLLRALGNDARLRACYRVVYLDFHI